jgi:hypothetical protein
MAYGFGGLWRGIVTWAQALLMSCLKVYVTGMNSPGSTTSDIDSVDWRKILPWLVSAR